MPILGISPWCLATDSIRLLIIPDKAYIATPPLINAQGSISPSIFITPTISSNAIDSLIIIDPNLSALNPLLPATLANIATNVPNITIVATPITISVGDNIAINLITPTINSNAIDSLIIIPPTLLIAES